MKTTHKSNLMKLVMLAMLVAIGVEFMIGVAPTGTL